MNIDGFYQQLWQQYLQITPQAGIIHQLFKSKYAVVLNDHVAFRTFDQSPYSIDELEPILLALGYHFDQCYTFKEKKLNARSYLHDNKNQPRFFISELCCGQVSEYIQNIIKNSLDNVSTKFSDEKIFSGGLLWPAIDYDSYLNICSESEYAAWLLVWGFRVNHFTININSLRGNPGIHKVAGFLRDEGFELNSQGGIIKGEVKDCLQQISTMAEKVSVAFRGGDCHRVPGCYYEFAMRYPDDQGRMFEGFVAANADKIFESTNKVGHK